jgi:uncharacterized delta-60 repeat protein
LFASGQVAEMVRRIVMAKSNFSSGAGFGEDLSPGVRVGGARFLLKRLLGRGENSEVWLAQDVKASREVALKFLPAALLSDKNVVERLKQEAQRNYLLLHPHIAATYEFVRDHSSAAIVTEYVEGWSLATFKIDQPEQRYSVAEIEWWMHQLGTALDFAHSEFGIVHRDVKPANLLVNAQDEIKVTDFGIAQIVRSESSRRGLVRGISGGLGFLSPQQVMGAEPSPLDDIYSFGATIFDLLTSTPPFYKGEIIAQVCGLKPPSMKERLRELGIEDDSIPAVWEETVAACLAKNPADRPQSVKEVLQLLERSELPKPVEPQAEVPAEAEPVADEIVAVESPEETAPVEVNETKTDLNNPFDVEFHSEPVTLPRANKSRLTLALTAVAILVLAAGLGLLKWKTAAAGKVISTTTGQSNAAGSLDKSFNPGTGANGEIRALALQPDGKILVGGKFTLFNGQSIQRLARLNADGSVDGSFAPNPHGVVHAIALQADGKILVGGETMQAGGHPRRRVLRLNADGSLDKNYKFAVNYNREIRAILVQPDGKILVGGSFTQVLDHRQGGIVRLNADGTLDKTFALNGGASAIVFALALQPDGKILVAGKFTSFDNRPVGGLVRLLSDGNLDESFKGGTDDQAEVLAVNILADGKILAGGNFTRFNGAAANRIARLNPDGTVDTSFNPGSGPDAEVMDIAVQPDGKIVIGGNFTNVQGAARNRIARLEADGRLDKNMNPGGGADKSVWRMASQADGKIVIAGAFENFDGVRCGGVARLQN